MTFLVSFLVPRAILQVLPSLPELYPDSFEPVPGPLGALALISAYNLHVVCLDTLLLVGLSLGALHWLVIEVVHFILTCSCPCTFVAWLLIVSLLSCACEKHAKLLCPCAGGKGRRNDDKDNHVVGGLVVY